MSEQTPVGRRILIVDGDPHVRAVIGNRLQDWGFEAIEVESGHAGLRSMLYDHAHRPIGGVLLALRRPIMEGMAVLHEIRVQHPAVPVIVMSDITDIRHAREAVTLGAQEYVLKPFDSDLLKAKCLRVFLADPADLFPQLQAPHIPGDLPRSDK